MDAWPQKLVLILRELWSIAFDIAIPQWCPCCGNRIALNARARLATPRRGRLSPPCVQCIAEFREPPTLVAPLWVSNYAAALAYGNESSKVVLALKRGGVTGLAKFMADAMVDWTPPLPQVDLVCWVPTTKKRIKERGFDQGELLALHVSERLRCPCVALLDRKSAARSHADGQSVGVEIVAKFTLPFDSPRVLVVDDVRTTGQSLSAAARACLDAGASQVYARTFAATPGGA